jgi:hypothetical protein
MRIGPGPAVCPHDSRVTLAHRPPPLAAHPPRYSLADELEPERLERRIGNPRTYFP